MKEMQLRFFYIVGYLYGTLHGLWLKIQKTLEEKTK